MHAKPYVATILSSALSPGQDVLCCLHQAEAASARSVDAKGTCRSRGTPEASKNCSHRNKNSDGDFWPRGEYLSGTGTLYCSPPLGGATTACGCIICRSLISSLRRLNSSTASSAEMVRLPGEGVSESSGIAVPTGIGDPHLSHPGVQPQRVLPMLALVLYPGPPKLAAWIGDPPFVLPGVRKPERPPQRTIERRYPGLQRTAPFLQAGEETLSIRPWVPT